MTRRRSGVGRAAVAEDGGGGQETTARTSYRQGLFPSARQLVRQDGSVTAPRAGRGRPGWPMAAHQLASAYNFLVHCGT